MLLVDRELSALVAWAVISARFRIFFFFLFRWPFVRWQKDKNCCEIFFSLLRFEASKPEFSQSVLAAPLASARLQEPFARYFSFLPFPSRSPSSFFSSHPL